MKKNIFTLGFIFLLLSANAATFFWNGNVDMDWSKAGNWTNPLGGGVPGANDFVVIQSIATANNNVAIIGIDEEVVIEGLLIQNGGNLIVNVGAKLTIRRDDFPTPSAGSGFQDNVCIELAGSDSQIDNFGTIIINGVAMRDGSELIGVLNKGRFFNGLSGSDRIATLTINNDVDFGILANGNRFFNNGIININNADGAVNPAGAAISLNGGDFTSNANFSEIYIRNCTQDGIRLNGSGDLVNGGVISMTGVGETSLSLTGTGEFTNEEDGVFSNDSEGFSSIFLNGATMTNSGFMELNSTMIYSIEILNNGTLNNEIGASIEINLDAAAKETTFPIVLLNGLIFNKGDIVIDKASIHFLRMDEASKFENTDGAILACVEDDLAGAGIRMEETSQFLNEDPCSGVLLNRNITLSDAATFTNRENAWVQLTTSASSEVSTNDGTIVKFASGVVNVGNGSGEVITANSDNYIWVGFENSDWNTFCNWVSKDKWKEESIPVNDLSGRVRINTQTNNDPIIQNLDVTVGKVSSTSNNSLTIQSNSTLTINGTNLTGTCLNLPNSQVNNNGELSLLNGTSGMFLNDQSSFINDGSIDIDNLTSTAIAMLDECTFTNNGTIDIAGANTGISVGESTFNNNNNGDIVIDDVTIGIILPDQFGAESDEFNNSGSLTISNATEGIDNKGTFINSTTGTINVSDVSRAINTNGLFDNSNQVTANQNINDKGVIIGWSATGITGEFFNRTNAELSTTSIELNGGQTFLVNLGGVINTTGDIFSTQIDDNNATVSFLTGDGTYNIGGNLSLINTRIADDNNSPEVNTFNFNGGDSDITLEDGLVYEIGNLYINSSGTVTINRDFGVERELQVNTGTFTLGPNLALVADIDTLIIEASGTLNASDATINLTGNWENNGTFTAGTSTVNIIGDQDMKILGTTTTAFDSLYIEKDAVVKATINADFSTQKQLLIEGGDVLITSATEISPQSIRSAGGTLTNNGRINAARIDLAGEVSGDGIYDCTGVFTASSLFEEGTSTVIMSGADEGFMLVVPPSDLYDLIIDKSTTSTKVTTIDNLIDVNDLTIKNGIFENEAVLSPVNVFIETGGTLNPLSSYSIDGDVENNGQINAVGSARLFFFGDTDSEIRGNNPFTLNTLVIDKSDPNADLLINTDITINTAVEFDGSNQGNINIGTGTTVTLASGAFIDNETEDGYIYGEGSIQTTVDLNAPSAENPGNIGVEISSSANLESTTIERFHQVQMSNDIASIARYYDIMPTTNTGLDARVKFYYLDVELGSINEEELNAYRLISNTIWDIYPATSKNTDLNFVEIANLNAFSTWTLFPSDLIVLPVSLTYFDAKEDEGRVILKWATASELNNAGFEVEHSINAKDWKKLAFVEGAGTTVTEQVYQYIDATPTEGINYYRLKQIDEDGQYEYTNIKAVKLGKGKTAIIELYPNPVTEQLYLEVPTGDDDINWTIYNEAGSLLKTGQLRSGQRQEIGVSDLAKGAYFMLIENPASKAKAIELIIKE